MKEIMHWTRLVWMHTICVHTKQIHAHCMCKWFNSNTKHLPTNTGGHCNKAWTIMQELFHHTRIASPLHVEGQLRPPKLNMPVNSCFTHNSKLLHKQKNYQCKNWELIWQVVLVWWVKCWAFKACNIYFKRFRKSKPLS